MEIIGNNKVTLSGEIASDFEFSHKIMGEKFYIFCINVRRKSGNQDALPVLISDHLFDVSENRTGQYVTIAGSYRSYNKQEGEKKKLFLQVFAEEIEICENGSARRRFDNNEIFLDGYICMTPIYRKTPSEREITDILIAVNQSYGKTYYIPSICWGRNARFANRLEVGTHITAKGRIQSREYQKKISDDEYETRTAYEVSIAEIEAIKDVECEDKEVSNG